MDKTEYRVQNRYNNCSYVINSKYSILYSNRIMKKITEFKVCLAIAIAALLISIVSFHLFNI